MIVARANEPFNLYSSHNVYIINDDRSKPGKHYDVELELSTTLGRKITKYMWLHVEKGGFLDMTDHLTLSKLEAAHPGTHGIHGESRMPKYSHAKSFSDTPLIINP